MKNILFNALVAVSFLPFLTAAQLAHPINIPLDFYGKIVDQDDNPMAGVKVQIEVRAEYFEENRSEGKPYTLETDQNGDFTLAGAFGSTVNIESISMQSYELSPKAKRKFIYTWGGDIFHPDRGNPVIFRMWKKGSTERLVVGKKRFGIASDGKPYTIDFLEQKKKEGIAPVGDIIVRINRPTSIPAGAKFDWSYSIEALNGGILHTNDDFMYRAPQSGYQPKYEITMSATNKNWQPGVRGEQFYVKSRNGQVYGSLTVEIIPVYKDESVFKVEYAMNPNGSQNLER